MGIHMGKLKFVLEVRHGAETANDRACAARTSVLDGKAGEALDSDVLDFGECLRGKLDPFVDGKERARFFRPRVDRDDYLVEQAGGAFGEIDVAEGNRIEATRIDGDAHAINPSVHRPVSGVAAC